jgi:formylglycine-generating enzyme
MFRIWWLGALAAALALLLGLLRVEFSRLESSKPVDAFKDCLDCPEMVVVPPGAYTMGSPSSEKGRFSNEGPQHHVVIAHPLAVGKYEVTRAEFARFVADTAYTAQDVCTYWTGSSWESSSRYNWENPGFSQTPSDPVVCVTWNDAKTYVDWLSKKTGKRYRLLSEAEWEYVSRASTTTIRPWGDGLARNDANYGSNECCQPHAKKRDQWGYTAPVGSFAPNRFGLYDVM